MNEYTPVPDQVPSEQRTMAMAAHLLGIITLFIGTLIIWLMNKDNPEKAFVTEQAKEALNFQITLTIVYIVGAILTFIVIGALLNMAAGLAGLVLAIIAAIKANEGIAYRYPFALRLIN